jgi:hypothetical protein
MTSLSTSIDIDAPPSAVWRSLVDFASYPDWNPHLRSAEGELREGAVLHLRVDRAGAKTRDLTVTITDVDPERRIEWVGTLGFGWLFEGRHAFELESIGEGRTRLHNREEVSGLLRSLVVTDDPERDYEAMNRALKTRVEHAPDEGVDG